MRLDVEEEEKFASDRHLSEDNDNQFLFTKFQKDNEFVIKPKLRKIFKNLKLF